MPWRVLGHLVSLEAFLAVGIMAGLFFGAEKVRRMVAQGSSLGRVVFREGVAADEPRPKAVRDFAPLRTKARVQQFAGSTDWLRQHMPVEYAQALKL